MSTARRTLAEELFDEVADQPLVEQRRLLEEACGEDCQLMEQVLALLEADASGGHEILSIDIAKIASELLNPATPPVIPGRFGRYVIREYLGHGGMGWVYLAERDGLGDRVAVKFLHSVWSSPSDREKFAREQQTLASLNHPCIARLYDAGVAEETPWFAMEYVEGVRIADFCQSNQLDLRARLKLFRSVCEAVNYAHRHLIVHLDLKPSNILVNSDGGVKLLDFGIARNLDREGGEAERTQTGLRLFSLNYAAPEQIRGEALDIHTDIHGLGVVLYELLTGRTPADLTDAGAAELLRYTEEEVERPSSKVRSSADVALQVSKAEWSDLDVLCLTATHRDRARRYESVEALIRDLDRFMKSEPLEAQTDSVSYRLTKFLSRRRREMVAASAIVVTVIALSVFFTVGLIHARDRALSSEARMQRIHRLMLNLFEGDDSNAGPAEGLKVVTMLDRGAQEAESLNAEPSLQAELRYTIGDLYQRLGQLDRAEPLIRSALQSQKTILGPQDVETLHSQLALAMIYLDQSKLGDAQRLIKEALTAAQRRYQPGSIEVAGAQAALGKLLATQGDYKAAVPTLESAVTTLSNGPATPELSDAISDLANTEYYLGNLEKSEGLNQRALKLDQTLFGERHPQVGVDLYNFGNIELDRGRYDQAEQLFRRALAITRGWYGELHPKTASNLLMLGRSLRYEGHLDEAAGIYNQALAVARVVYGQNTARFAYVLNHLGGLAEEREELDKAEMLFRQSADIFGKTLGKQHEFYAHQLSNLASVYIARRQYREAELILRPALQSLQASVPNQRYTGLAEMRLGAALAGQRQYGEAEQHALAGHDILRKQTAAASAEMQDARRELYALYTKMNEPRKAAEFRTKATGKAEQSSRTARER